MNIVQPVPRPSERRIEQRDRLIACAEALIAERGLAALKARDLAMVAGCSVGAIYNAVADLDELVLLVGQRTMADLLAASDAAVEDKDASVDAFVVLAVTYCRFAAANRNRWQALFEFRLPPGRDVPEWFARDRAQLFIRLEARLAKALPHIGADALGIRARTLFSAVHGIVALGLEEKLVAMPASAIEQELAHFVRVYLTGLAENR